MLLLSTTSCIRRSRQELPATMNHGKATLTPRTCSVSISLTVSTEVTRSARSTGMLSMKETREKEDYRRHPERSRRVFERREERGERREERGEKVRSRE